ncbi:MAG TPA: Holliday junction resolvase RuvX [Longimicrobiales bacterium]|nr:Holliday junction resolvase RuvX [Longimicrobiales bacterium]
MRVLGIDFGEKRVGMAVSDPTGTLASPVGTLQRRRGKRPPLQALAQAATDYQVEKIVVGLPLTSQGEEDAWCREVRAVGAALAERTGLAVVYVDERFSSRQAERHIRSSGLPRHRREEKDRVDAGAAAVILQAFLDGAPPR